MDAFLHWLVESWEGLAAGFTTAIPLVFAVGFLSGQWRASRVPSRPKEQVGEAIVIESADGSTGERAIKRETGPTVRASIPRQEEIKRPSDGNDVLYSLAERADILREGDEVFVPVYYGTNRNVTGNKAPNRFFGSERSEFRYGRADVSIPASHTIGVIEAPSIFRLEFSEDSQKHVVLRAIIELDENQFSHDLAVDVARLDEKAALIFVHGFNVTFDQAARRTAQMAYDLFLIGHENETAALSIVPILYSWPSNGEVVLYPHDVSNADASVTHFKNFIASVAKRSGARSLTVIAHSMGNRTLAAALNEIGLTMQTNDPPLITEIILAAPDIDRDVFLGISQAIKKTGQRVTLYASSRDYALKLSKAINGYPRLGDTTDGVTVFAGADSIDATVVGDDILAHSYYGDTNLLTDLYHLIINRLAPAKRFGLLAQGKPPNQYWRIRERKNS